MLSSSHTHTSTLDKTLDTHTETRLVSLHNMYSIVLPYNAFWIKFQFINQKWLRGFRDQYAILNSDYYSTISRGFGSENIKSFTTWSLNVLMKETLAQHCWTEIEPIQKPGNTAVHVLSQCKVETILLFSGFCCHGISTLPFTHCLSAIGSLIACASIRFTWLTTGFPAANTKRTSNDLLMGWPPRHTISVHLFNRWPLAPRGPSSHQTLNPTSTGGSHFVC